MSQSNFLSKMRKGSEGEQDFELNLASIIDCFTVIITFMLASASFLSIGILDAGVAVEGPASLTDKPPAINITLQLTKDQVLILKVAGKENRNDSIPSKDGKWDLDILTTRLSELKTKYPEVDALTLTAENSVQYRDVVKAMEVTRKTIPVVLLGGF